MLISIGLGHLGWEILPGRSCLGPYGRGPTPFLCEAPRPHPFPLHCNK